MHGAQTTRAGTAKTAQTPSARPSSRSTVTVPFRPRFRSGATSPLTLRCHLVPVQRFPAVAADRIRVDAPALCLVQRPESFDVMDTETLFGDILSDPGADIIGALGMAPSPDLGETLRLFQRSHGTAPILARQGIVHPIATLFSIALLLERLDHPEPRRGACLITGPVADFLAHPDSPHRRPRR